MKESSDSEPRRVAGEKKKHPAVNCLFVFFPQWGGLDLNSSNRGFARLGGEGDPPLGVVVEEVAVLVVLFSPRLARSRGSLSCESACRAHAGAVCVKMLLSRVRRC